MLQAVRVNIFFTFSVSVIVSAVDVVTVVVAVDPGGSTKLYNI